METSRLDRVLVQQCLHGDQKAWKALIDKYKNLIFSIPIKYGFSSDDAADIFQSVCLALVSELPRLREPRALPAWLIRTTAHKCFHWKSRSRRDADTELQEAGFSEGSPKMPEQLLAEVEREEMVREAILELSETCKRLVELLFYQIPSPSYDDIAMALRIPKGSIGPTRIRCLDKLKQLLEKKGF